MIEIQGVVVEARIEDWFGEPATRVLVQTDDRIDRISEADLTFPGAGLGISCGARVRVTMEEIV